MPLIKVNQTMLDMAVQHTGQLDGLFALATLNGKSITAQLEPGTTLLGFASTDRKVSNFFEQSQYDVVTIEPSLTSFTLPTGIGYMQVGSTFIVS